MEVSQNLPPPGPGYRPLTLFAKLTTALFVMYGAAVAFTLVWVQQLLGYLDVSAHERDHAKIVSLASRFESIEKLGVAVFVGCVVTFCVWTYRAVANARVLGEGQEISPGMAVGYHFIPIVNLWKPLSALRQAWCASEPRGADGLRLNAGVVGPPAIMGMWWLMWLVSRFATRLASSKIDGVPEMDTAATAFQYLRIALVAELVAAVLAVTVVWKMTRRMERSAASPLPVAQVASGHHVA